MIKDVYIDGYNDANNKSKTMSIEELKFISKDIFSEFKKSGNIIDYIRFLSYVEFICDSIDGYVKNESDILQLAEYMERKFININNGSF